MKAGLTLTEILIAMAIVLVLASVGLPLLGNWPFKVEASSARAQMVQMIRLARERSLAGLNNQPHGVYFDNNSYTVFQGASYADRQSEFDFKTTLDKGLNLSWQLTGSGGANEIVFNQAGAPARLGKIIVASGSGESSEISVNKLGIENFAFGVSCIPNCTGKTCGNDGCGGICGTCQGIESCVNDNCVVDCGVGTFFGGAGTASNPYQICNCRQLQNMNTSLSAYYVLVQDINCSETSTWNAGTGWLPINSFSGNLNGGNYAIKDLSINRSTTGHQALFGVNYSAGLTVSNVSLINFNIRGGVDYDAALVGRVDGPANISNVKVIGGIINGNRYGIGGLVGSMSGGSLKNSSSSAVVTCSRWCGGLVGQVSGTSVSNSYATGNVTAVNGDVGGFVGEVSSGNISNSYATGNVVATKSNSTNVGGFVGTSDYAGGTFVDCFSTGLVLGKSNIGGFLGLRSSGTLTRVYWDETRSGKTNCYSGGNLGCTAKNTSGVPEPNYWYSRANAPMSSWNFTNIWQETTTYPILR